MATDPRDDWGRIRQIFEAALEKPAERRPAFVGEACRGEEAIHDRVIALLAAHEHAAALVETPALDPGGTVRPVDLTGQRIGPYLLASLIGRGGMGEVYRARDTRLDRTVAIKVVAPHVAADQRARERFEREARAVAALNHPHICTVHDVGSHDGVDFLVMEFLEGETLATRLARGPLPVPQALDIAVQIASALDRAHRSGIVHRDLKPANVMLTASRAGSSATPQAKLLDFGLAKTTAAAIAGAHGDGDLSELTTPGTILGTLHYMAPEQLEGLNADARTDLFAFGCVLYEMVTGKKAFDARSSAGLLTAIMAVTPTPVRELQPSVPPGIEYIVERCLEKDPDDRWQTARDLLAELKRTVSAAPAAAVQPPRLSAFRRWRWIGVPLVILAAVGGWLARSAWSRPELVEPASWLSILPPPNGFDLSPSPSVSPDGRYVVFKAENASHTSLLWIKDLSAAVPRPLPGPEGVAVTESPFWSPDSRSIGFFALGKLRRVDIDGGAPQVLAPAAEPRGGTWSPSGVIIFNNGDGLLHRVSPSGGALPPVPGAAPGQSRLFPHALPDGRHYLFTSRNVNGLGQGIYVASLDSPDVRRVSDAWSKAVYAAGHLVFGRQGALFVQPFDSVRLETTGEPRQVADGLGVGCCTPLSFQFSASNRVLAFWSGTNNAPAQLTWFDRDGKRLGAVGEPGNTMAIAVSQDGRRVVLERADAKTTSFDLWLLNLAGGSPAARLTVDGNATSPVWSPDGTRLLVMYRARGLVAIPWRGGALETVLGNPAPSMWPSDWSADGRVAFNETTGQSWRLVTAPAVPGDKPTVYRESPFWLGQMRFFPGEGWVAYSSDESGPTEVYIDSFPTAGEKIRVSANGGGWPVWRRDGKELYYLAADRSLMAVAVRAERGALHPSPPARLFEAPASNPDAGRPQFASNADGSRFLFNARVEDKTPVGLTVIDNWPTLLAGRQSSR